MELGLHSKCDRCAKMSEAQRLARLLPEGWTHISLPPATEGRRFVELCPGCTARFLDWLGRAS